MEEQTKVHGTVPEVARPMSATTCNVFNELSLEGELCDVVIQVEELEFNAHKAILCGCSPFFR